jgi:hypothetical protein
MMPDESSGLGPLIIIGIVCSGGAIGGFCDVLNGLQYTSGKFKTNNEDIISNQHRVILLTIGSIIGSAGAISIQFVFILLQSFKDVNTTQNIIFLFSISIAAGFGARRILPSLTDRLERQIQEAKEDAKEAKQEAKGASQNLDLLRRYMIAMRPDASQSERDWALSYLRSRMKEAPLDRETIILIGRLLRVMGRYEDAINELNGFIGAKERVNQKDKDYADVLYNISCYQSLMYADTKNSEWKIISLENLSHSIKISPNKAKDAQKDSDFDSIREDAQFKKIIGVE